VRSFAGQEAYETLVKELAEVFARADFAELVRVIDRGFGESTYSLRSLFRDEQRKVLRQILHGCNSPCAPKRHAIFDASKVLHA